MHAAAGAEDRTGPTLTRTTPDLAQIRHLTDTALAGFLERKSRSAAPSQTLELVKTLRGFLFSGGKRIRPVMCVCGWYAAGGGEDPGPVVQAAASLELFHAFALIHDDVMDRSATRRGQPAVHTTLADRHRPGGNAEQFGTSAAILLGDLALTWSDEMFHAAGLPSASLQAALPLLHTMRSEVMFGQYLDLLATGQPTDDVDHLLAVIRFKTAKYTVERPLHIGAALADSGAAVLDALTAYALPLGEAFQLRDDLLGVFGDPAATGKPHDGDLREGKGTVLMALGMARADPAQLRVLRSLVGRADLDEEGADAIRGILVATGARSLVEQMIADRCRKAMSVLDSAFFPPSAAEALHRLVRAASIRTS